ncbi:hypothetical protein KSB_20820 [Ktedonobacter robiniae]|uniref:Uncharacterized protein n=1 Tax=Ktedonobacter robiniae TaxID=2778365 RepID=A0ABQ3UMG3_9CHLR|nr:hypothetical protein KSB_20820 [Ktedonobacter robiniae]
MIGSGIDSGLGASSALELFILCEVSEMSGMGMTLMSGDCRSATYWMRRAGRMGRMDELSV